MATQEFVDVLLSHLESDIKTVQINNIDIWRYPMKVTGRFHRILRDALLSLAERSGFLPLSSLQAITRSLSSTMKKIQDFQWLYENLADEYSRRCLIDVVRFKILGDRYVKLPRNNPSFWNLRKTVESVYLVERKTSIVQPHWELNRYNLGEAGYPIVLDCLPLNVITTFGFEQYAYRHPPIIIDAPEDAYVIDAGGCWGDTALYFSERVGKHGAVFCFEFAPQNLPVLYENITRNVTLSPMIRVIENPTWCQSDVSMHFVMQGPGTTLIEENREGAFSIKTISIDDMVKKNKLNKIDFIKMDIEGAELESLKGAVDTLSRYKPQLAISVYHRSDDIVKIPHFINNLELGYKFYLDHFTIYGEETVLFCTVN